MKHSFSQSPVKYSKREDITAGIFPFLFVFFSMNTEAFQIRMHRSRRSHHRIERLPHGLDEVERGKLLLVRKIADEGKVSRHLPALQKLTQVKALLMNQ